MKRFEAFLGNAWAAWVASENVTIGLRGKIVTVETKGHPEFGDYKTIFDLNLIPAYTLQK